ncbi:MAG: antibiotic biosynthesis monooxygenase [Rhodoferax sp.]|nr:antibiotic biosynthesis monooxygenase [Rhodoferax sp.]
MNDIQVIVTFEARPESTTPLSALLSQVRQQLPLVDGCKSVRVLIRRDAPQVFTLVEDWQSTAQHQKHLATVVASGAWDTIAALLAADPVSHTYGELPA